MSALAVEEPLRTDDGEMEGEDGGQGVKKRNGEARSHTQHRDSLMKVVHCSSLDDIEADIDLQTTL